MAEPASTGMEKTEMKKLLALSKKEPVYCAIGQGKDASMALLLLDKHKQPKAVGAELDKKFPDSKNTRWGTAFCDTEVNAKLVKFTINKAASGLGKRLVKTLKGTGFSKVEIVLEDGTPLESVGDEEEEGAPLGASESESQAGPQAAAAGAAPDAAMQATAGAAAYGKAGLEWRNARKGIETDIDKLCAMISETYREDGLAGELETSFKATVKPVLDGFDEALSDALDDAGNATDPQRRSKLVEDSRAIIARYQQFLASDAAIAALDENPFMPLTIKAKVSAALTQVSNAIR